VARADIAAVAGGRETPVALMLGTTMRIAGRAAG
jgi:hypothetical protein